MESFVLWDGGWVKWGLLAMVGIGLGKLIGAYVGKRFEIGPGGDWIRRKSSRTLMKQDDDSKKYPLYQLDKMRVWQCGIDHGMILYNGPVFCPCGLEAIPYDEWVKRQEEKKETKK